MFTKHNLKYKIIDALFKKNNEITKTNKTMTLYLEGNTGRNIQEYSYWKVYHEWLYDSVKPIYDLYNNLNTFKYDDEKIICDYIQNCKPFMMARVGNTELWIVKQYIQKKTTIIT